MYIIGCYWFFKVSPKVLEGFFRFLKSLKAYCMFAICVLDPRP